MERRLALVESDVKGNENGKYDYNDYYLDYFFYCAAAMQKQPFSVYILEFSLTKVRFLVLR